MPNLNKVFLMGHLAGDADLRSGGTGRPYMLFTIAINDNWTTKEGKENKRVDWIDCFMFGDRASSIAPMLVKGKAIFVEGKLRKDSYERDGKMQYVTRVEVSKVEFLTPKPREQAPPPIDTEAVASLKSNELRPPPAASIMQGAIGIKEEDIPF